MHRATYRNFGTHESLVTTNQSAEYVFAGTSRAGWRWWELAAVEPLTLAQPPVAGPVVTVTVFDSWDRLPSASRVRA